MNNSVKNEHISVVCFGKQHPEELETGKYVLDLLTYNSVAALPWKVQEVFFTTTLNSNFIFFHSFICIRQRGP